LLSRTLLDTCCALARTERVFKSFSYLPAVALLAAVVACGSAPAPPIARSDEPVPKDPVIELRSVSRQEVIRVTETSTPSGELKLRFESSKFAFGITQDPRCEMTSGPMVALSDGEMQRLRGVLPSGTTAMRVVLKDGSIAPVDVWVPTTDRSMYSFAESAQYPAKLFDHTELDGATAAKCPYGPSVRGARDGRSVGPGESI
jgi:hypothetical protein